MKVFKNKRLKFLFAFLMALSAFVFTACGSGGSDNAPSAPHEDITNPTNYGISYGLNGGVNSESNPDSYNTAMLPLSIAPPSREGFTFEGWFTNPSFSDSALTEIPSGTEGDIVLYAKWRELPAETWAILYDVDGGKPNPANPSEYKLKDLPIVLAKPSKDGFAFLGWFTDSEFAEGTKIETIAIGTQGDIHLYAKWEVASSWARSIVIADRSSTFHAVAVDDAGNSYAVGEQYKAGGGSSGTFYYGKTVSAYGCSTGNNAVIVKYDNAGRALWASSVSEGNVSYFYGVAADKQGNVYAVGDQWKDKHTYGEGVSVQGASEKTSSAVIVKYDAATGKALWARSVTSLPKKNGTECQWGVETHFYGVAVDASGSIYAVGEQQSPGTFGYGSGVTATGSAGVLNQAGTWANAVIVKYDKDGNTLWARSTVSGNTYSCFNGVTTDAEGNIYTVGHQFSQEALDYGSGPIKGPSYSYSYTDPYGSTISGTNHVPCAVMVKYSSDGPVKWAKTVEAMADENPSHFKSVAADSTGVYACGWQEGTGSVTYGDGVSASGKYAAGMSGGDNAVVVKYSFDGTVLWAHSTYAATGVSRFCGISADGSGNVYAAGFQNSNNPFKYDSAGSVTLTSPYSFGPNSVLVKYSSDGNALSGYTVTSAPMDSAFMAAAVDAYGCIRAVGYQNQNGTFTYCDGISVKAHGGYKNSVIVKYK